MRYKSDPSIWESKAGWRNLRFAVTGAHYYQYLFRANSSTGVAAKFTSYARADLDCDGTTSYYRIQGSIDSGSQEVVLKGLLISNGLE